jgi:hypothetical protein
MLFNLPSFKAARFTGDLQSAFEESVYSGSAIESISSFWSYFCSLLEEMWSKST